MDRNIFTREQYIAKITLIGTPFQNKKNKRVPPCKIKCNILRHYLDVPGIYQCKLLLAETGAFHLLIKQRLIFTVFKRLLRQQVESVAVFPAGNQGVQSFLRMDADAPQCQQLHNQPQIPPILSNRWWENLFLI